MRISDWSSDVCSSDLSGAGASPSARPARRPCRRLGRHRQDRPHPFAGCDAADIGAGVFRLCPPAGRWNRAGGGGPPPALRSEEHTSELQSLMRISYAVFCLKKKKNNIIHVETN